MQESNNSFREIRLLPTYSSLDYDLVDDVVVPILEKAVSYDRGVGFFTTGWLKEASKGVLNLVKNHGKARIVTSPQLSEEDWLAIKAASDSKLENLVVEYSFKRTFEELEAKLETDTLSVLTWLIRDDVINFKFAIPTNQLAGGIFHSKLSLFKDNDENGIALHGSQNDSQQASLNEETLSVFCSWNEGIHWYNNHVSWFNRIWNKEYNSLRVIDVQEAEKEIVYRYTEMYPRPYDSPKQDWKRKTQSKHPSIPSYIKIREYQNEAIQKWLAQDRKGVFQMATGTGKTITAISAAIELYMERDRLAMVILVPYIHLVDQWIVELEKFGFDPISCYLGKNTWWELVNKKILQYNSKLISNLCLVTTHTTAATNSFQKVLTRISAPWLLIGDEIHGLGASVMQTGLSPAAEWRLGLSATPDRWYDETGSQVIKDYFGEIVIDYGLKEAISNRFLCPYKYFPILIDLDENEIDEYIKLSSRLAKLYNQSVPNQDQIEMLLRKRANIIGDASNKTKILLNKVQQQIEEKKKQGEKFQNALFYCNAGSHREILKELSNLGIKVHEFVHDVSLQKRKDVLSAFAQKDIDGLVAIKCLDEGVDVPSTQSAFVLASSTNPREFVQRRGRILRNSPGKRQAQIYDFLVGPWNTINQLGYDASRSLMKRELPRFAEFAQDSENEYESRELIWNTVKKLDLILEMKKRPWEVYKEAKESRII